MDTNIPTALAEPTAENGNVADEVEALVKQAGIGNLYLDIRDPSNWSIEYVSHVASEIYSVLWVVEGRPHISTHHQTVVSMRADRLIKRLVREVVGKEIEFDDESGKVRFVE